MDVAAEFVWSESKEEALVELWAQSECLYDTSSVLFKDRNKKQDALQAMSAALGASVEEVKKRMQTLRTAFSKVTKPAPSGSSGIKLTKKNVWVQEKLQFLLPFIKGRQTISNLQNSDESDNELSEEVGHSPAAAQSSVLESEETPHVLNPTTKRPLDQRQDKKKTKAQRRDEEELNLLKSLVSSIEQEPNNQTKTQMDEELVSFSQYVAHSLNKMDVRTRNIAKNMIQNCIFQAEIGNLLGQTVPGIPPQQSTSYTLLNPLGSL